MTTGGRKKKVIKVLKDFVSRKVKKWLREIFFKA